MRPSAKHIIAVTLILLLSLSGCIDIRLSKEIFVGKPPLPRYAPIEKAGLSHTFEVRVFPNISTDDTFNRQNQSFPVVHRTSELTMRVDIKMMHAAIVTTILEKWLNISIPEELTMLLETRYVNVTLTDQDGEIREQKEFKSTVTDYFTIADPSPGLWEVEVRGVGLGNSLFEDTISQYESDSYSVEVWAEEPA